MRTGQLKALLERRYGAVPDPYYDYGDMDAIRAYFDYRQETNRDGYLLDDTTWADLDMDRIFRRINPGLSTSGEQYLYYMLRSPALDPETFQARQSLIELMGHHPKQRLKLQLILSRLGRSRQADLCRGFSPGQYGPLPLLLFLFFCLLIPFFALLLLVSPKVGAIGLVVTAVWNGLFHEYVTRKIRQDFATVNYSVSMVFALRKVQKLHWPELDVHLSKAYEALHQLRAILRTGGISTTTDSGGLGDVITTFLLLDLVTYAFLRQKLWAHREDIFAVHGALGQVDAAIAVASYRASLDQWCLPEVDFRQESPAHLEIRELVHPLLSHPIPNDLDTERSMLITGSNASGKSTFLKAAALSAVLAQSICTCPAHGYSATAFHICSSIALRDNIRSGESYYIVETRSLKRIMDLSAQHRVLCVIDEILRGTNTVERIAASSTVLEALADAGALCIAATHDIELCGMLASRFSMYHFEEQIQEDQMVFDYQLRPGPASTRNAIRLLKLMGFADQVVEKAQRRADRYFQDGVWES